jgi:arabinofuranan 3-O-arabinosyltransferase
MTLRPTYRSSIEDEADFDASASPDVAIGPPEAPPEPSVRAVPAEDRMSRIGILIAATGALVITFIQQPGNIVDDTKLPLVMSPLSFMANSLQLWNPIQSSGSVQVETYGYLFPMGPFFALGEALHIPVWITERVWLALLLTVSFWGVVRLAEALGIGGRSGKVAGAVAYTIAPIVVTWAASSAALLAVVFLPWVVLPLVRGAAGGSPRRAAAASGVAIALMGGVNATVVLVLLPVPIIWLLTRQSGPRRRALVGWWIVAVGLACFWWAAALLIQDRYGYNYLPYTETSTITTSTASLFEAVRGASFWTGYFTLGGPQIPGVWALISTVPLILGTVVVAALGLVGLAWRGIPERLFLVACFAVGVLGIAVGYGGPLGAPAAHGVQRVLQEPFGLLRNVGKFSPDVSLPLALGLAWLVSTIRWGSLADRARSRWWSPRSAINAGLLVVVVVALVAASAPFWQSKLYPSGGFSAIPAYWGAAARWLDNHQSHGTALLVPGAAFGKYTWGNPLDEPLSVDLSSNWDVRSLVPFGSNGNDLVMDTVEASLDQGVVAPGMADYLARAGYDYVVVRNDLNLADINAPPPAQVQEVLSSTPGLRQVASFGPVISLQQAASSTLPVYDSLTAYRHLRSVLIYRVLPAAPVVRTYPASNPVVVSGSPSSLLPLVADGTLTDRAAVLAGDPHGGAAAAKAPGATWADTDGNQRREQAYGQIRDNYTYILGPKQRAPALPDHAPDVPLNLAVVSGVAHQTVAGPIGAAAVSASSFGSTTLSLDPAEGPAAALSPYPTIAWVASDVDNSTGQWVQINFLHSTKLDTIELHPLTDTPGRPRVTKVTISTSKGSVERTVQPGVNKVTVPHGSSTWLRITLTKVQPARINVEGIPLGAGLTGVAIPGVSFQLAYRLPSDEVAAFGGSKQVLYSFNAPLSNPNLDLNASSDDDPQMIRRFTVPRATTVSIAGAATPLPGYALDDLLPVLKSLVQVSASSTLADLPRLKPTNLLTDSGRPWIAGFGDNVPTLTFSWIGTRSVGSIVLKPTPEASTPRRVIISSPAGTDVVNVPKGGGTITFPPMDTHTLKIEFVKVTARLGKIPSYGIPFVVPVGVQSLSIPALKPEEGFAPRSETFGLPCGDGPTVTIDGKIVQTAVLGTVTDLEDLQPLYLAACGGPISLSKGQHVLEAGNAFGAFKITGLVVQPSSGLTHATTTTTTNGSATARTTALTTPESTANRSTQIVGAWTAQQRTVKVGAGPASYLVVAQNYNPGWKATLNGRQLTSVRVDGWQQAWMLPAGPSGTITMVFAPDGDYHLALLLGAVFLCVLGFLALRRGRRQDQPTIGPYHGLPPLVIGTAGLVILALLAGPLALALLPLLVVARRWGPNATAAIAGLAFLGAGIAVAVSPGAEPLSNLGAFSPVAQALSAIAVAAVLASLIMDGRRRPAPDRTENEFAREDGAGADSSLPRSL